MSQLYEMAHETFEQLIPAVTKASMLCGPREVFFWISLLVSLQV